MKILLIYPPMKNMIMTEIPTLVNTSRGYLPPLGLLYIASYLDKFSDHEVSVLDADVERCDYDTVEERIRDMRPDVVGIQAQTFSLVDAVYTADRVKKVSKDIITIFGGPHVPIFPGETIKLPNVDYIIMGEAEKTFCDLVNEIAKGVRKVKMQGVGYKYDGEIYVDKSSSIVIDKIDELPMPDRKKVPYKKYYSILAKTFPITTMMTSRACPYQCSFCSEAGTRYRAASPEVVVDEMEECCKLGIKEIFVHDDTFTVNKKRVVAICEEIHRRGLKFNWEVRGRVDTVTRELLQTMARAGVDRMSFGVESGSQKVLDGLQKGIRVENVIDAFKWAKEAGMTTLADFMFGSPGEGENEIRESIALMKKIAPDYIQLSMTTPYPGTKLYRDGMAKGFIKGDPWRDFAANPRQEFIPPVWGEYFSREELNEWVSSAYHMHYMNPKFIVKKVFGVRSPREFITKTKAFLNLRKLKGARYA